jgi:hypothetical protein
VRLIAKIPTLAAFAYRHALGLPYNYPDGELSYTGNLLNMFWKMTEPRYHPDPVLSRALDVLFILHADHEQNCSTSANARGRQLAGRPVLRRRGGRCRPVRPLARRRERAGAPDAA